jgi:peroxiredoxin Q/BCP
MSQAQPLLAVGSAAPQFEVTDQSGAKVSSQSLRGKRYVMWFFPKADTPG